LVEWLEFLAKQAPITESLLKIESY
jgi:hypothetical protein